MANYKKVISISIIFILIIQVVNLVVAFGATGISSKFSFKEPSFELRGDGDERYLKFNLPDTYTMKDVEVISENEDVAIVLDNAIRYPNFDYTRDRFVVHSIGAGNTKLVASIKGTDIKAYCEINVKEAVLFTKQEKNMGINLVIDCYSAYYWSEDTRQAVEISVTPINSTQGEKWIRLGEGQFASATNKVYNYEILQDSLVQVRYISWWVGDYFDGENEFYRTSIVIDDLEPISSIGARVIIYDTTNRNNKTSTISSGEKLQLGVSLIEIDHNAPVTWRSYQVNAATVDNKGLVTGKQAGIARIEATATEVNGKGNKIEYKDIYTVIVGKDVHAYDIIDNYGEISNYKTNSKKAALLNDIRAYSDSENESKTNGAFYGIIPDELAVNETDYAFVLGASDVIWSSDNNKIAKVNENGKITAVANGEVTISAEFTYNNKDYQVGNVLKVGNGIYENNDDTSENSVNETNIANNVVEENNIVNEPVIENNIVNEPVIENNIVNELVVENNIVNEPVVENNIVNEPVVENNIVNEPVIENNIVNEPVIENNIVNESVVENNIVNEPIVENNTVNEVVEENIVKNEIKEENKIGNELIEENKVENKTSGENELGAKTTEENKAPTVKYESLDDTIVQKDKLPQTGEKPILAFVIIALVITFTIYGVKIKHLEK